MEMNRQQPQQRFAAPPVPDTGLYSFANEHDACGVGLVADLNNVPSHRIVGMGMTVLKRLMHRGAAGCCWRCRMSFSAPNSAASCRSRGNTASR